MDSGCDRDIVRRADLDDECFYPRHVYKGCKCPLIEADSSAVADIITAGKVPVFTVTKKSETVTLALTASVQYNHTSRIPYVAISHVRSDGLGNSTHNALYACALEQIQDMADSVSGLPCTPFWIDSLCVPHGVSDTPATGNIRQIFSHASLVLVLSRSLLKSSAKSTPDILRAIRESSWIRRVWTLQEGAVAKCLFFQFATGPVNYDSISNMSHTTEPSQMNQHRLYLLGRMSDDVNGGSIRTWQRNKSWSSPTESHLARVALRRLLRIGYICVPRFEAFATTLEKQVVQTHFDGLLEELYSMDKAAPGPFDRLDRLQELAETVDSTAKEELPLIECHSVNGTMVNGSI